MPKKDEQITFRLSTDVKAQLRKIADETGRTMAQICDAFIKYGIKQYKAKGRSIVENELRRD